MFDCYCLLFYTLLTNQYFLCVLDQKSEINIFSGVFLPLNVGLYSCWNGCTKSVSVGEVVHCLTFYFCIMSYQKVCRQ